MARIDAGEKPAAPRRRLVFAAAAVALAAAAAVLLAIILRPPAPAARLVTLRANARLSAVEFRGDRTVTMTMVAGTAARPDGARCLRVDAGRILANVRPGDGEFTFITPHAIVTVPGTELSLFVEDDATTVAVVEGVVTVRTGQETPVRVVSGNAVRVRAGERPGPASPTEVWQARDFCAAPSLALSPDDGALRLSLRNDTLAPVLVRAFDPAEAVYSLAIRGPGGTLSAVLRGPMVTAGSRGPADPADRSLAPGEALSLLLDTASLGLPPGEYLISAVYRPYGDLPPTAWRGNLESTPIPVTVR